MKKYYLLLLILFVSPTFAWAESYVLTVDGMVCDFCVQGIPKKLTQEFKPESYRNPRFL